MAVIRSNVPERSEAWLKSIEKQAEQAAYRALSKVAIVGETRVKQIMQNEAYDTGRLLRSVTSVIYRDPALLRLVVGTNLDYAGAVEHGRKAGKKGPPPDAIVAWVGRRLRAKGINTRVNTTIEGLKKIAGSRGKGGKATAAAKAARIHLSVVYLVGRKIRTKGIRQKLIFKRIEAGLLAYFRTQFKLEVQSIR